jgi:hypothetical protein
MKRYLGVDLHRTQFVVCTRLENGQHEVRQWRIGQLQEFVEQLQSEDEIATMRWWGEWRGWWWSIPTSSK